MYIKCFHFYYSGHTGKNPQKVTLKAAAQTYVAAPPSSAHSATGFIDEASFLFKVPTSSRGIDPSSTPRNSSDDTKGTGTFKNHLIWFRVRISLNI